MRRSGARADLRPGGRAVRRARRVLPARHHVRRPPDGDGDRAARTSTSWSASTCSATCAPTRPTSPSSCTAWRAITRSSATCAARATSCRSSWSRTARRAQTFSAEECQVLLREFLSPQLQEAGVICRADDRGDPVIQLSPPLICTREHIDEAVRALDSVLPARAEAHARGELTASTARGRPRTSAAERLDVPGLRARRRARPRRRRRRPRAGDARRRLPARRLPVAARHDRRGAVVLPAAARRPPARSPARLALAGAHAAPLRLRDRPSTRTFEAVVEGCREPRRRRAGHLDQRRARGRLRPSACARPRPQPRGLGRRPPGRRHLRRARRRRVLRRVDVPPRRRTPPRSHWPTSSRGSSRQAAGLLEVQHRRRTCARWERSRSERALYLGLLAELRDDEVHLLCDRLPVRRLGTAKA